MSGDRFIVVLISQHMQTSNYVETNITLYVNYSSIKKGSDPERGCWGMDPFHLYQVWVAVDIIWFHHFKKNTEGDGEWQWVLEDCPLQCVLAVSKYIFQVRGESLLVTELREGWAKAISLKACPDSIVLPDQF